MIVSISGHERQSHSALFEKLFRARHHVFVVDRQWTLPSGDGMEIDQYDCDNSQYFFSTDDDGEIRSHVRLTPTVSHSLLADLFPHLCEPPYEPRSESIYEATRYIVLPRDKSLCALKKAKAEILGAAMQWAFVAGLSHVQTVIDAATLASFLEISPECRPLGLPHSYAGGSKVRGGGEAIAIRCPATAKVIADIRAYGNLPCPRSNGCGSIALEQAA